MQHNGFGFLDYASGDSETKEAFIIDGSWDVDGLEAKLKADGYAIKASVSTHYHWDHIGGSLNMGKSQLHIPGIKEWASKGYSVYVPTWELDDAAKNTETPLNTLTPLDETTELNVGRFRLSFIHTPGHSPGSVCILVSDTQDNDRQILMVTGDTIFPGSCGRLDLPGSDPFIMYDSLQKLKQLDNELPILPGHSYSGWGSTVGKEKSGGLLKDMSRKEWNARHVPRDLRL